jgi:peptidoglycan/xylan/chitin deacetylase (PgdA/CDA1 family)
MIPKTKCFETRQLTSFWPALLIIIFLQSCTQPEKTYVTVVFDVEDYISPVEDSVDEIPKWLAETMTEVGVTGTFFVIGEKARSLEERGRQDVIRAMAAHDIGSHTNLGSIHPTVTEILENAGWDEGVIAMLENESTGFEELERIFGIPVSSLARHGGSYGPQLVYALGQMGKGYVYSPVSLPGKHAVWFCNTLNFHGDYGAFDDTYYNDELFNPLFDTLKMNFMKDIEGVDMISFFAGHPTKIRAEQFWDFNFYEGANPVREELQPPVLRPAESMVTARKNFRRLMQFLKDQEGIEIVTIRELMERFSYQPDEITRGDLLKIAERIRTSGQVVYDEVYSPAEVFLALAESLQDFGTNGRIPGKLQRIGPLGPMMMPPETPGVSTVTLDQVMELATAARDTVRNLGYLPSCLQIDEGCLGTGTLLHLFSRVFLDINDNNQSDSYEVIPVDPYPTENAEAILSEVESYKYWIVHRPDLEMSHLVNMTRLQLWTLKPAHEK